MALAVTIILLVDRHTLGNLGQAAFFTGIVAVMLPPSLALSLFLLAAITLLFGMILGWAWASAMMAAGLSVRNQVLLAEQEQKAQASLVQGIPAALQFQKFIFEGRFLDPRTTGVYAVFLFIGTFALGALRAYAPKLALTSIFGSIVLDVMATYGPLFPTAQYTLPKMFILPTVYYVAVALMSLIIIFPESLNHVWLTSLCNDFLAPMMKILSVQSSALSAQPSDHAAWAALTEEGAASRQGLLAAGQGLLGQIGMVDLEVSVGRLGPGDLKRISSELQSLMFRASGLHAFQLFVNNTNDFLQHEQEEQEKEQEKLQASSSSSSHSPPNPDGKSQAGHQPELKTSSKKLNRNTSRKLQPNRFTYLHRLVRQREAQHGHDLDSLVPILSSSSEALREACENALASTDAWFRGCNSGRWSGFFFGGSMKETKAREEVGKKLVDVTEALKKALGAWRETERVGLIKPYERFFDAETRRLKENVKRDKVTEMFAARSLFICFVFSYALDAFAERLLHLLDILVDLDAKRSRPRVWMPSGFGKLGRKIMSRRQVDQTVTPLAMGTSEDPTQFGDDTDSDEDDDSTIDEEKAEGVKEEGEEEEEEEDSMNFWHRRNPDALPPTTAVGRSLVKVGAIFRFFKSPEGVFSFRVAVVSVALWVPAVCPSTAWFYYGNRGLWALIMAQMGLAVYAGDQIAGFVVRLAGTIIGLLIGMAVWYIGAGSGNGNPYGIVIATTVFVAPCFLGRLAAPPQQVMLWTMIGITIVFVVGYSWINTHLLVISNLGVGVTIGWKRALLVIIGFTASFIVMMFPRPTSSRTLVRRTLAATISELGHLLAVEVEALLAEEVRLKQGHHEHVEFVWNTGGRVSAKEKRVRKIAQKVLVVAARLRALAPSLSTAKYDPQVQGTWPHEKYARLHKIQMALLSSLTVFAGAFVKLDTKWCSILVLRTPFLNPNFLADVFTKVSILSYALAGGHPLPASLPMLRDRLVYHERLTTHVDFHAQSEVPADETMKTSDESDSDFDHDSDVFAAHKVDGSSIGFEEMTLDILMDEQLPAHSTALVALSNIISLVDEMGMLVRDLCGEKTFHGFDDLQRDFLGREEKVIGGGFVEKLR